MKIFRCITLVLFLTSTILAGSTSVQKSEPVKIDSQQVMLPVQVIDSLRKANLNQIIDSLDKKVIVAASLTQKENRWITNTGLIKDLVNIGFWLIAGIIAILTYIISRKTLFNPLRTEVIKKQVEVFSDLLKLIDEPGFGSYVDIININALHLLIYFDELRNNILQIDKYKNLIESSHVGISLETNEDKVSKFDFYISRKDYRRDFEVKIDCNNKFLLQNIIIDKGMRETLFKLKTYSKNPFLPIAIKNKIGEVHDSFINKIENEISNFLENEMNSIIASIADKNQEAFSSVESVGQIFREPLNIDSNTIMVDITNRYFQLKLTNDDLLNELRNVLNKHLRIEHLLK